MLAKITALGNTGYQAQEIYLTSVVESCIINFDMTDVVVGCYTTEEYIFFPNYVWGNIKQVYVSGVC